MGRRVITRAEALGTSGRRSAALLYGGPCELLGLSIDFSASADSGTVVTIRDGSSSGLTKYTTTGNTDIGTTVPVRVFHDARIIAGTATAGVGAGVCFFDGPHVTVASDVAGPQTIKLYLRPLTLKRVGIPCSGAAGSATGGVVIFNGAGRLSGARVFYGVAPSTTDVQLRDGVVTTGAALTIVSNTNTDWAAVNHQLATTTSHDEAGTGVTTAATGAYANDGVLFGTGLYADITGADPNNTIIIDALIEV